MKNKLILTDCDGVLLHWEWMFDIWMQKHGYKKQPVSAYGIDICYALDKTEAERLVTMFNETVYIRSLPPFANAIKYVKKLHEEHGAIFHVITSISSDPFVVESRIKNLHDVFGKSMFYRIDCLDPSISKKTILKEYKDSDLLWLEDHPENYNIGIELGLNSVLFNQHYNTSFTEYNRVIDWKDFYERYI